MSPFRRLGEWLGIVEPEDEPDEFSFADDGVDDLAGFEPTPPRTLVRSSTSTGPAERRYDVRADPARSRVPAAGAAPAPPRSTGPTAATRPAAAAHPAAPARPTTPTGPARSAAATQPAVPRSWARPDQRWAEVDIDRGPVGDLDEDLGYDEGRYDEGRYDEGRYDDSEELFPSLEPAPAPRARPVSRPGPDGTIPFPVRTEPARTEPARAEPARAEPARAEPARTEPARSEPARPTFVRPTAAPAASGSAPTSPAAGGSAASGSASAAAEGESLTLAPSAIRERALVGDEKRQITALAPTSYAQARDIGLHFRDGHPVIMNLTEMAEADAKRLVDFAAGLAFGLRGSMERVTNRVFLLSPANVSVSAEERRRIAEGGYRPTGA